MTSFAGRWITSFGPMELQQDGNTIKGTYWYQGTPGPIDGVLEGDRYVFRYEDASGPGRGWFELSSYGQFRGQYCLDGTQDWHPWTGQREWDGIWDTSFGRMRLIQEDTRVHGFYDGMTPGQIEGTLEGSRLVFRYQEPAVAGEGWFELSEDTLSFAGEWRPDGAPSWGFWEARRVLPKPGATWLVVIEAHWQNSLADRDYSYGSMLKEIFARLPNVAVRQRFFNDEASLARWCREVVYFPDPAIVLIASHGTPAGVTVHGKTINTKLVIDCLRYAHNIQLLHFSACLVMKEETEGEFARKIEREVPFPISGYTTSVDWGGSALVEFNYLDMILGKRLTPERAAELLPKLVAYAGDEAPAESPYVGAGFRFFKAKR
jgi:hypothetical protein